MDSKLRKTAILVSLAVILFVSAVVVCVNRFSDGGSRTVQNTPPPQGQEGRETPSRDAARKTGQIGNNLSAFLEDPAFFDPEYNPVLEAAKDAASRLSLIVTSVERDLRIQIVDVDGEPVRDKDFTVELEGMGEYTDPDRDGVIYIGGMAAGDYYVKL